MLKYEPSHTIVRKFDEPVYYGVKGLMENLQELFAGASLPIMVKGVLLPFVGKIIIDGMFEVMLVNLPANVILQLYEALEDTSICYTFSKEEQG